MMKRALSLLLLTLSPAFAQAPTGSNMGLAQYPAPNCTRPQGVNPGAKPTPPPEKFTDEQAIAYNKKVDAYNAQMRTYNEQSTAFGTCINTYIANGNADMRRIRDALDAAVGNAK
jgi:hypothetical protein